MVKVLIGGLLWKLLTVKSLIGHLNKTKARVEHFKIMERYYMAFGVKKETANSGTTDSDYESNGITHSEWAVTQFETIDAEATQSKRGLIKEFSAAGVLNCILNLGYQPQEDQGYPTKVALPEEGEENSAEELEHIKAFPDNYYKWVDEDGKQVRKQFRKMRPESELALAFDFNEVMLDYSKSPYGKGEDPELKPLRISMNGWFNPKKSYSRIRNTINFKTKKMHENNPLYKIAKASGILNAFTASGDVNNGHDYALLAGVVVELDISAELTEWEGKKYIEYKIKNPSPITDIKVKGKVVAKKEDIIKDAKENIPDFVGIELDDKDFEYTKEDLAHIRQEWKIIASRAVGYKPSPIKFPDFTKGCDWKDSTLYKACVDHGVWLPKEAQVGGSVSEQCTTQDPQEPKEESKPVQKVPPKKDPEPTLDFDSDIPF